MHIHVVVDEEGGEWPQNTDDPWTVLLMPARFTIETAHDCPTNAEHDDDLAWDVTVEVVREDDDEAHVVEAVSIRRRPGGPPASAANIRGIPLGSIVASGLKLAAMHVEITERHPDGSASYSFVPLWRNPDAVHDVDVRRAVDVRAGRARRNDVSPEMRASALALFEMRQSTGVPGALEWVAEQLQIGRSTAGNWIKRAREEREEREGRGS